MKEKLCAGVGGLALVAAVCYCQALSQGSWKARAAVGLAIILLAGLWAGILKLEKVGKKQFLILLAPIGLALLVRCLMLDRVSDDFTVFLDVWLKRFRDNGGILGLKYHVGNYNVPYLYCLSILSYFPVPNLYLIKLLSIFFDGILAWGGFRLVHALRGEGSAPALAFSLLLLSPLGMLNSASWGQCEAIYGSFALHALACLLEGKSKTSVAMMGLAFSFKLQAVFILPLWGVAWLAKKVKFWELWIFPATYLLTCLPAALVGRPWKDILGIYFTQAGDTDVVSKNAPNLLQFLPYGTTDSETVLDTVGLAAVLVLVLALLGIGLRLGSRLDNQGIIVVGALLAFAVPYFLPYMHDRYFFLAEVAAICLACFQRQWIPVAVLAHLASFGAYYYFVFGRGYSNTHIFPIRLSPEVAYAMPVESTLMTVAVVMTTVFAVQEIKRCFASPALGIGDSLSTGNRK